MIPIFPSASDALKNKFEKVEAEIQNKLEIQMLSDLKISDPLPDVVQPKAVLCKVIVLLNKTESGEVFYTVKLSKKMPDAEVPNVVIPQTQDCLRETDLDDMYDD
jgi:hypothetical protein